MTMAGLVHDVTTAGATQSPESLMSEEEEIEADTQTNTAKYESARAKTRREKNRQVHPCFTLHKALIGTENHSLHEEQKRGEQQMPCQKRGEQQMPCREDTHL